jgi:hypothetical protein
MKLTSRSPTSRSLSSITAIRHCYFMFFKDMATPHALCINAGICSPAKSAPQSWFFSLGPALGSTFLQVFLLCWTPASRGFQSGRVRDRILVRAVWCSEIIGIEKPFWVLCEEEIGQSTDILVRVGKCGEGWVNEEHIRVFGGGFHGCRRN